jgi:glycosyltransferase involved in cell wall biosynthesis
VAGLQSRHRRALSESRIFASAEGFDHIQIIFRMPVPVSFIIPIKNEAANLRRCLSSISWSEEIWVVDSASTDASQSIAEEYGAKVVQFQFNGVWPKKKNWALENIPFNHEWVFILDADEVLPTEAEEEIRRIVTDPSHPWDGYWINRRFNFLGQWLRHAYYPNWNLRFFKHRLGRYEKMTDGPTESGDNEVHEHVVIAGGLTGRLKCEMDHYAFPSVSVFMEKHNRYSNWEARVAMEESGRHQNSELQLRRVGWRRRIKRFSRRMPFRPFLRFIYVYILQLGILDGRRGFHFACLHAVYEYLCVVKTFELKVQPDSRNGVGDQ